VTKHRRPQLQLDPTLQTHPLHLSTMADDELAQACNSTLRPTLAYKQQIRAARLAQLKQQGGNAGGGVDGGADEEQRRLLRWSFVQLEINVRTADNKNRKHVHQSYLKSSSPRQQIGWDEYVWSRSRVRQMSRIG
jgi:hypothetical protein